MLAQRGKQTSNDPIDFCACSSWQVLGDKPDRNRSRSQTRHARVAHRLSAAYITRAQRHARRRGRERSGAEGRPRPGEDAPLRLRPGDREAAARLIGYARSIPASLPCHRRLRRRCIRPKGYSSRRRRCRKGCVDEIGKMRPRSGTRARSCSRRWDCEIASRVGAWGKNLSRVRV